MGQQFSLSEIISQNNYESLYSNLNSIPPLEVKMYSKHPCISTITKLGFLFNLYISIWHKYKYNINKYNKLSMKGFLWISKKILWMHLKRGMHMNHHTWQLLHQNTVIFLCWTQYFFYHLFNLILFSCVCQLQAPSVFGLICRLEITVFQFS